MILELFIVLLLLGAVTSAAAFGTKTAPVYSALANFAIWAVVAYSAVSIDVIADDGTVMEGAVSEPALGVLAFGNAALSVLVIVASATGSYGDSEAPNPTEVRQ